MTSIVVVKVGGSLLEWSELPFRLAQFLEGRRHPQILLIAGGGRATDLVRDFDATHQLGESHAHALALRSLDLSAYLLNSLVAKSRVIDNITDVQTMWNGLDLPILAPRQFLDDEDSSASPLPHLWSVTSDTIAARVALHLKAKELVLLKSVAARPGWTRDEAARQGVVDPYFVTAAAGLAFVSSQNLRDPQGKAVELL